MSKFVFTQLKINAQSALQQFLINRCLTLSLLLDLVNYGQRGVVAGWLENYLLEDLEALVTKLGDRFHLDMEPVKVLEQFLHPFDHDLVISPLALQLDEQLLAILLIQILFHVGLQILLDGVRIL